MCIYYRLPRLYLLIIIIVISICSNQAIQGSFFIISEVIKPTPTTTTSNLNPSSFLSYLDYDPSIDIKNTLSTHNPNEYDEETELSISFKHQLIVDIQIGSPPQIKRIKFATHPLELWVLNSEEYKGGYTLSKSLTANNLNFCQEVQTNGGIQGEGYTETINLLNYSLQSFPFLLVINGKVDVSQYVGGIGFGYNYAQLKFNNKQLKHVDYSILDTLKSQGKIDNRILNVDFIRNTLSLGSITDSSFNKKYLKTCNLIQIGIDGNPNAKWECMLDSAFFIDKNEDVFHFKIREPVTFSLGSNVLLGSMEFYDWIVMKYLKVPYGTGLCGTKKYEKYYVIECSKSLKDFQLPAINFVIGKWTVKIPLVNVLLENKIMIAKSEKKTKWIFGYPFLRSFMNIFDKEMNTFGIYQWR